MKESLKNEIEKDINSLSFRIYSVSGAIATIAIIATIIFLLKLIPESIGISIGLFTSLPLIYSFIFGIIFNKKDFQSVLRHYSFTAYILLILVIFMIILKPTSIFEGFKYFVYFVFGFIIAVIGYIFYLIPYRICKKLKYRWQVLISFGVSLLISLIITFILKHYGVFEII